MCASARLEPRKGQGHACPTDSFSVAIQAYET